MKKWTVEQVIEARGNNEKLNDCEPWLKDMFGECGRRTNERLRTPLLSFSLVSSTWTDDGNGTYGGGVFRIPQNWPPADQIEDAKPTPADFSTQYMLGGEPYHPEDDETELQRLIDGRDDMNDGIKVIRARRRRFKRYVAKKEGVKG